ncbi:Trehalose and maltose hydrolases (possible phosphorylases) (plasmid) [Mycoplasmopsis canis]|uniref:Trehalose and maltose hydrolases (Possible phosphorylases) n=1 Tax=Mycoplasmopsis canis TaxID=29555 RepID=A0A449ARU0_9BACT|nr:Trehalose and maltose hydrolases (possible phosphorylases) [Mycoplasmopsis canis]
MKYLKKDKYNKTLFIREGVLKRTVEIERESGRFELTFERFVSRDDANVYGQRIQIKALEVKNANGVAVLLRPGINGQVTNSGTQTLVKVKNLDLQLNQCKWIKQQQFQNVL